MFANKGRPFVFALLTFGGLALTGLGSLRLVDALGLGSEQVTAQGSIVGLIEHPMGDTVNGTEVGSIPIVQWTTEDGAIHRLTGDPGGRSQYQEQDSVTVLFDPTDPMDARIRSFGRDVLPPLLTTIAGFLLMLTSARHMRRAGRRKRQ